MTEEQQILSLAAGEIWQLRYDNAILRAKVQTMDTLAMLVMSRAPEPQGIGMTEDIAWRIDQYLAAKEGKGARR